MTDYKLLCAQLESLSEGVDWDITVLANAAGLLWDSLADINWAGFYLARGGRLVLGPFQGKPACTAIEFGKGVCGTAVAEDRTQLVPDVHQFPGHIACDSASNSEIVVPIHIGTAASDTWQGAATDTDPGTSACAATCEESSAIYGVLDIDSPLLGRFTEEDRTGLETVVAVLESVLGRMFEVSTDKAE